MNRFLLILAAAAAFCFADDVVAPAAQNTLPASGIDATAAPADSASTSIQEAETTPAAPDSSSAPEIEAIASAPVAAEEPDSIAFFKDLIRKESADADFAPAIAGAAFSGALLGAGLVLVIASDEPSSGRSAALGRSSVLPLAASVPLLVYSARAWSGAKECAAARDEYHGALERHLKRKAEAMREAGTVPPEGPVPADESDIVAIYRGLIADEAEQADVGANLVGFAIAGALIGSGIAGFVANSYYYDDGNVDYSKYGSWGLQAVVMGVPILVYNVFAYRSHKMHAALRDEYHDALERHLKRKAEKRNSVQTLLVPTVDAANSGAGLSLAILF